MKFEDMKLQPFEVPKVKVKIESGVELDVYTFLPIEEKGNLVTYIVNNAIDENTGCFSPLRLEVFYVLGIMKWYAGLEVDDTPAKAYDFLEYYQVIDNVLAAIPEEEREFVCSLIQDTVDDISRYNNSLAGMLSNMTKDAGNLGEQVQDILEKIKNKEGLEVLSEIKNVVGSD